MKVRLLPILVSLCSLAALPKIYFDKIWLALFFDAIFVAILFNTVLSIKEKPRVRASLLIISTIIAIAILEIFNPDLETSYNALHGFRSSGLYMLALYIPILTPSSDRTLEYATKAVIIVSVLSALNALRQYIVPFESEIAYANTAGGAAKLLGDDFQGGFNTFRPFSTFVTSVHLALYLSFGLVLCYFSSYSAKIRIIFSALISFGILATLSRTSYMAVAVMVVVVIISAMRAGTLRISRFFGYTFLMLMLAYLFSSYSELFAARIGTLANIQQVSSFESRFALWAIAIRNIAASPWGYGTGAGSWAFKDSLNLGSDSGYLKIIIEFGWIGGGVTIMFLLWVASLSLTTMIASMRIAKVKNGLRSATMAWLIGCSGLIVTNLVQMITNQTLEAYPNNLLFWLACGFVINRRLYIYKSASVVPERKHAKNA